MNWLWAPMLNRPARNATATDRPARISGVAWTQVSDSGLNTELTVPSEMATENDFCWNNADTECGLKIAPSKMATQAPDAASQAWAIAWPGLEKKSPQACSTLCVVNAISRPPSTIAMTMARIVRATELPSRTASRMVRLIETFSSGLPSGADSGGAAGVGADSLTWPPSQGPLAAQGPLAWWVRRCPPSAGRALPPARP